MLCDTDEQMRESVARVKRMADDYELLRSVRYEFMEQHDILGSGKYRTRYSNGVEIEVDYSAKAFRILRNPAEA